MSKIAKIMSCPIESKANKLSIYSRFNQSMLLLATLMIFCSIQTSQQAPTSNNNENDKSAAEAPLVQAIRPEFEEQSLLDKRSSAGFLPMRGRKSESIMYQPGFDVEDDLENRPSPMLVAHESISGSANPDEMELFDLLEKRSRVNSFMPMRGRKSDYFYNNRYDGQMLSHFVPPAAAAARMRYYSGSSMMAPQQQSRFTPGVSGGGGDPYQNGGQKRGRGVAFFGSRGKRSIHQ